MRSLAVIVVAALFSGCADSSSADDECAALDTWQEAHQRYLDEVGSASVDALSSPALVRAGAALGSTLLEAGREAVALDCEADLVVGAPPRCRRVDELEAGGPGGQSVVDSLLAQCA